MSIFKKDSKKDFAPIGFFFDLIPTEHFKIPILPIPMRIDKVVKGEITFFINFNMDKLHALFKELNLFIDFKSFFLIGLRNLIEYAKKNSSTQLDVVFKKEFLRKWFDRSISIEIDIPDLTEDFTYLLTEFLKTYSFIIKLDIDDDRYIKELITYCDRIIEYFKGRMESNLIKIKSDGVFKEEQIYYIKKSKYYPRIIEINIETAKSDEKNILKKMRFVPYLIYDDILDTFSYNKILLAQQKKTPYPFKLLYEKEIIHKGTNINNNKIQSVTELKNIDMEKLINDF